MTNRALLIVAGVGVLAVVVITATVTALVVSGASGGGSAGEPGGGEAAQPPPEPETADVNGEWAFAVSLEPDEAELPAGEIVVLMDLMQAEDGSLTGRGSAEYNGATYEVEVEEGQVSEDGRVYVRLIGPDDEGDDFANFTLYDEEQGGDVSGTAEGSVYFEPSEDPYGVGKADAAGEFTAERQ